MEQPKLIKSIPIAEGSDHVAITPDEHYAFVQNALLNLPGMSDGSVIVVDLQKQEVVKNMDTLKDAGLTRTVSFCCRLGITPPATERPQDAWLRCLVRRFSSPSTAWQLQVFLPSSYRSPQASD